jgi:hypothetical protein
MIGRGVLKNLVEDVLGRPTKPIVKQLTLRGGRGALGHRSSKNPKAHTKLDTAVALHGNRERSIKHES